MGAWHYCLADRTKKSPFDVYYGGWGLLHVDENINYSQLLSHHQGITAALIGIAGCTVSALLAILFILSYWFLIINMVPLFQYIPLTTFSTQGDIGRFVHGLNISPWWVFIPGSLLIVIALWRIFSLEIPRAYAVIPLKTIGAQRVFLLTSLGIIFLLIYTHGYNPVTDKGSSLYQKILSIASVLLVPILFFICNPSRNWVKNRFLYYSKL